MAYVQNCALISVWRTSTEVHAYRGSFIAWHDGIDLVNDTLRAGKMKFWRGLFLRNSPAKLTTIILTCKICGNCVCEWDIMSNQHHCYNYSNVSKCVLSTIHIKQHTLTYQASLFTNWKYKTCKLVRDISNSFDFHRNWWNFKCKSLIKSKKNVRIDF